MSVYNGVRTEEGAEETADGAADEDERDDLHARVVHLLEIQQRRTTNGLRQTLSARFLNA